MGQGALLRRSLGRRFIRKPSGIVAPSTPLTIITSVTVAQWVRGDLGVTLGTGVATWADQSGNARDFTQGTGSAQPIYAASDATLNNQPTLTCDGIAMFMDSTWSRPAPGTTPQWIWAIIKQNAWTVSHQLIADKTANRFMLVQAGASPTLNARSNGTGNSSTALAVGVWGRAESYHAASTDDYLQLISTKVGGTSGGAGGTGTGTRIGVNAGGTLFGSMAIAELVIAMGLPTPGEIANMNSYATYRYGAGLV